jgi:hypothetical protein
MMRGLFVMPPPQTELIRERIIVAIFFTLHAILRDISKSGRRFYFDTPAAADVAKNDRECKFY